MKTKQYFCKKLLEMKSFQNSVLYFLVFLLFIQCKEDPKKHNVIASSKNEIQYVCNCYSVLCNVHQPNIGLTENQVRSLKVKTGITIWLLAYLYDILKE